LDEIISISSRGKHTYMSWISWPERKWVMPKNTFGRQILLIIAVLCILLVSSYHLGWWNNLEAGAYDAWFRLRGPATSPEDIVIVEMDDNSVQELGRPPWPRDIHGKLLDKLADAKVVAFDFTFAAPTRPAEDEALAEAVRRHGRVILATSFTFEEENGEMYQVLRQPLAELLKGAQGTGFINFPTEQDNVVRRTIPMDVNMSNRPYPSFALATALAARGLTPGDMRPSAQGDLLAGEVRVPLDVGLQVLINFWGPARTFNYVPYYQVLNGEVPAEYFRDKIVLVGPTTALEQDYFPTPFTRGNMVLNSALPTPGVELHASALASYLTNSYFEQSPRWIDMIIIAVMVVLALLVSARGRAMKALIYICLILIGYTGLVGLIWWKLRLWLPVMTPVVSTVLTFLVATLHNYINEEMERRRVQGLFGRYVNPSVVDYLLENKDQIQLGGQRREVTIMFSDIRGFTSFSEGKGPEEVVAKLNEYLTVMTRVIFKYGGTLDKYLGDGIMAVFGAPLKQDDHAERALGASKEMLVRLQELNKSWQEKGELTFDIGIGLNSGEVVVGNVGSPERMEYTAIGEEVNLAARLESMNKEYKTRIIFSERTFTYLKRADEIRENCLKLGEAQVRGLVQPIAIYTIEEEGVAANDQ